VFLCLQGYHLRVQMEEEPFPEDCNPVVIGVNSFGIGGSYAHAGRSHG
jgi:acyl transferase domain-containing protein